MADQQHATTPTLPDHIRENVIVVNAFHDQLHIVLIEIEAGRIWLRNIQYQGIYAVATWPFTVGTFTHVRDATPQEVKHAEERLKERQDSQSA